MHTEEKWSIKKSPTGRIGIYIEKFGFIVFAVSDTGDRNIRKIIDENLNLIAVAPDLLEACEKIYKAIEIRNINDKGIIMDILKHAINKAKGITE